MQSLVSDGHSVKVVALSSYIPQCRSVVGERGRAGRAAQRSDRAAGDEQPRQHGRPEERHQTSGGDCDS